MRGSGWLARGGAAVRCAWSFDGETVLLAPEGRPPEAILLREVQGIGGGEYEVELAVDGRKSSLSRLGADGPTLREALARAWLPARARALRLTGTGEPLPVSGAVAAGGEPRPFAALLFDDVLALARSGEDVAPLFLGLTAAVALDEAAYAVTATPWDGPAVAFSKLAGRTDAFARALAERRAALAAEAASATAAHLPTLAPGARAALSALWPPGRVLALGGLESAAPGFAAALRASWLPMLPRRRQAEALLAWAAEGGAFLGWARAGRDAAPAADATPEAAAATEEPPEPTVPDDPTAPLWLLARRGGAWLLECLSLGDHATYRFRGGDELPGLVAQLLCAPQFSREALYEPLASLVGPRAELAPAARDLAFLRALRERFAGRIVHAGFAAWSKAIAAAS